MKRSVIIIGAGGRLGAALMREWRDEFDVAGFNRAQLDIGDFDAVREQLRSKHFEVLVNCAAQTNVDRCETEREEAFRVNGEAAGILADICERKGARMVHISTDYVFDGLQSEPYVESDTPRPISIYGESKLEGERCVASVSDAHWIVRVSWVFGPDRPSFIDGVIERAMREDRVSAISDKFSTPTYTEDLAKMLPLLFALEGGGIAHATNSGGCSWQEYAQHALDSCAAAGVPLKVRKVAPTKLADMKTFVAKRPLYTVLSTAKFTQMTGDSPRNWRDAVAAYVRLRYSNL